MLLVLDSDVLTEGRDAPARSLLGHGRPLGGSSRSKPATRVSGIVIAANEEQLPAACTVVVRVRNDAEGTVTRPDDLTTVDDVVLAGLDVGDGARLRHRPGPLRRPRADRPRCGAARAWSGCPALLGHRRA